MSRLKYKQLDLTNKIVNADISTTAQIQAIKLVGVDINTVGTITTGTWQGTVVGVQYGGTGLTSLGSPLQYIRVNSAGTALEYATLTIPGGTVTSVNVSGGTTGLTTTGGPITSSGTITFTGTLNFGHGGTGLTTLGTAGQIIRVNSGATGLEYASVSALITLQPNVFTFIGNQINLTSNLNGVTFPKVLFLPAKGGAFRAGQDSNGNKWNVNLIGYSSTAFGYDTLASGDNSFAANSANSATGVNSAAFGVDTLASGSHSSAFGFASEASGSAASAFGNSVASGDNSFSFGNTSIASGAYSFVGINNSAALGDFATALGHSLISKSYSGFVIGMANDDSDTPDLNNPSPIDRIFQIGNGVLTPITLKQNALTVLRNGNFGFNKLVPTEIIDVVGNVQFNGALMPDGDPGIAGKALVSTGPGTAPIWASIASNVNRWVKDITETVGIDETIVISGDFVLENSNININGTTNEIVTGSLIFKEIGQIFVGGNLVLKDSNIVNDGSISVGGAIIFLGTSTIIGTGIIN